MAELTQREVIQIIKTARDQADQPDLHGLDLSSIGLFDTDLSGVDLGEANLRQANLIKANRSAFAEFLLSIRFPGT